MYGDEEFGVFRCGLDEAHNNMCLVCFGDYITYCCANYATLNTIPITCLIPSCEYQIPESEIQRLSKLRMKYLMDWSYGNRISEL